MKKKRVLCQTVLLAGLLCFLTGCGSLLPKGGTVDHSDPNAPKEIQSDELVFFEVSFYRYEEVETEKDGAEYHFELKKEDGTCILSEDECYQISCEVDEKVFAEVQKIIREYDLISYNGTDRYKKGIVPEYGPFSLSAKYASGESLYFHMNIDPNEDWTWAFLKYFRRVFADHGFTETTAPEELYVVDRFDFSFNEGKTIYDYGTILMPGTDADYATCLYRRIFGAGDAQDGMKIIQVPEKYYDQVELFLLKDNLYELANGKIQPVNFHSGDDDYCSFCIETVDGRQFNGWFQGEDIPEEMAKIKEDVKAFLEPVFEAGIEVER
ncbi:MAG: hypothetical protein J5483_06900 [Lachnospiraceae bacterium]|nr:hypothetical protein [Lachnospiraceae bacterium]